MLLAFVTFFLLIKVIIIVYDLTHFLTGRVGSTTQEGLSESGRGVGTRETSQ